MCRYIGIIGGSSCPPETARQAEEAGRLIAGEGWLLVTGGMAGVMEAACKGAFESGGTTIGILPGTTRSEGNHYLSVALPTGLGHLRNSLVVSSSDAIIAFPGSFGTLSEISFANISRIPVIGLGEFSLGRSIDNLPLFQKKTASAQEAVDTLKRLFLQ